MTSLFILRYTNARIDRLIFICHCKAFSNTYLQSSTTSRPDETAADTDLIISVNRAQTDYDWPRAPGAMTSLVTCLTINVWTPAVAR